ncbi:aig2-like family protein [Leptolyngbya sp. Heron Island J]|uniref:allophanate hydrolase-related protein n=1 Tax=Leptolyngbya sp. Heron Island J TaxID=1385935 RepID=UPI0003B943BE|nr:gamma-glutamylcyclotransferase [Leptolyngbya sp. Heron Island J]ESA36420.1 aig2-like family protein [Leptolyngbya sp. Heron Island J]
MADDGTRIVFICGSALRGQPDHGNLQSATFIKAASTTASYRLHAVKDGWHPGIYGVDSGGIAIPGELYELTAAQYDYLVSTEPPNMYPAEVTLADGGVAIAMLYPQALIKENNWPDISHHGGWAAYKAAQP